MRPRLFWVALLGFYPLVSAHPAFADDGEPVVRKPAPPPQKSGPPPATNGFQLALRSGYMLPFGNVKGGPDLKMSDVFSGQVPIVMDFGGKFYDHFFVGGYLGFGFGTAAGSYGHACEQAGVGCHAFSVRFGFEAQYHFIPDGWVNPWIGYGVGFESNGTSVRDKGASGSVNVNGADYAHFMAGVDFRLSETFGLGPYIDYSVGRYDTAETDGALGGYVGDIDPRTLHEWLSIGLRLVLFP